MQFSGVSRFLPSKRIGALVVVVAALITSTLILRADTTPDTKGPVARLTAEQENFNETDTDGDGVKDWEEELWGLSAVSPDTDGDGVGDADEVEQDRALFAELPGGFLTQAAENPDDVTPIGLAGRVLISQFLTSKQSGVPFTEKEVEGAADIALAAASTDRTYRTYTISDITIGATSDASSLRAYGNAIGTALTNTSDEPAQHELAVLLSFTQSEDAGQLEEEMQRVIDRYTITINGFLAMTVPSDAIALHLATVNAMERVKSDLSGMATLGSNPVAALMSLANYNDDSTLLAKGFKDLRALFEDRTIVFGPEEPAYIFTHPTHTEN
jgi:hypothetical protein